MIQIAICDDDAGELEKAGALLETYCGLHRDADMVCRRFSSGAELLACVNTGVLFDIYLLDILMPGLTGIEVGAAIRETDRDAAIVFLSSSDEFGVTSYRVRAYDYLIKPVEESNLFPTLDELLKQIAARRINTFPIRAKNGIRTVQLHRLVYVEYRNHKCFYHLEDGTVIESITLREPFNEIIAPILTDKRFVKSTISYLVNIACVKSIEGRTLYLTDGACLPVSRGCINDLRKSLVSYLLDGARGK